MYIKWFPSKNLLDRRTFTCIHRMCESGSFYTSRFDSGTETYRRTSAEKRSTIYNVGNSPSKSSEAVERTLDGNHLLAQPQTKNACERVPHWCNDASCLKFVRRMMIRVSKILLSADTYSSLYSHNAEV